MKIGRLICPGGYTSRNKGDAALVLCMLGELRRHFGHTQFVVVSDTPHLDHRTLGELTVPAPFDPRIDTPTRPATASQKLAAVFNRHIGWRISRLARALTRLTSGRATFSLSATFNRLRFTLFVVHARLSTALLGRRAFRAFPTSTRSTVRAFCEADAAIFLPGGYFLSPRPDHVYWHRHLGGLLLAHWLRLPVVISPSSIGPFYGRLNRALAQWALNKAGMIIAREEISVAILREIGVTRPHIYQTTDVAFLLDGRPDRLPEHLRTLLSASHGTLKVGMSVRWYSFPGHPDPEGQAEHYMNSMAGLVRHMIEAYGAFVCLTPHVTAGGSTDDDTLITRRVAELSGGKSARLVLIEDDLAPSELKAFYGSMDLFVGVRMHANIFALGAGVPTLAIAYEPKTRGIMDRLGLSDFVVSIREIDEASLCERFDRLFRTRQEVRQKLATVLPEVRRDASRSADIIANYLAGLEER